MDELKDNFQELFEGFRHGHKGEVRMGSRFGS